MQQQQQQLAVCECSILGSRVAHMCSGPLHGCMDAWMHAWLMARLVYHAPGNAGKGLCLKWQLHVIAECHSQKHCSRGKCGPSIPAAHRANYVTNTTGAKQTGDKQGVHRAPAKQTTCAANRAALSALTLEGGTDSQSGFGVIISMNICV